MKKLLLILLLLPISLFAQRDSIKVTTSIYTVMYSEVKQQPLWCEYFVQCAYSTLPRKGMDFHSHDGIITSDNGDYVNNIWDKGHCCPFKGSNCNDQAAFESFSYVNCSLQDQYLNRGTWRLLENYERELTSAGVVRVKVVLEWGPSAFWLPTGAMVPSGFYKYIWLNGHLHGVWYFPNKKPTTSDYMQYKIQ